MKYFFLLVLILLTVGCREEIAAWDQLTQVERDELRNRGIQNCYRDSQARYDAFKNRSDQKFDVSYEYKFARGQTWKIESKQGTTVSTSTTGTLSVWKLGTNSVYLLWTKTVDGTTSYKFVKIDSDANNEMITNLHTRKCEAEKLNISEGSDVATMILPVETKTDTDPLYRIDVVKTYTFKYIEIAFLGIFHESRVQKKVKIADSTIASTETYTLEITSVTNPPLLRAAYTDYGAGQTSFCIITKNGDGSYPFNYGDRLNCSPTASEFDPAVELLY